MAENGQVKASQVSEVLASRETCVNISCIYLIAKRVWGKETLSVCYRAKLDGRSGWLSDIHPVARGSSAADVKSYKTYVDENLIGFFKLSNRIETLKLISNWNIPRFENGFVLRAVKPGLSFPGRLVIGRRARTESPNSAQHANVTRGTYI